MVVCAASAKSFEDVMVCSSGSHYYCLRLLEVQGQQSRRGLFKECCLK